MDKPRLTKVELQLWEHQAELGSRAIRRLIDLGLKAKEEADAKEATEGEAPRRRRTTRET